MRQPVLLILAALCCFISCKENDKRATADTSWRSTGSVIVMDTHTHTVLSTDATMTVGDLVAKAVENGCTALAVTDHSALEAYGGTEKYFDAVEQARGMFPNLFLFGGIEWDIPPYAGREHVTVLLGSAELERRVLPSFRNKFEKKDASAEEALSFLADQVQDLDRVVLIYNHPSRRDSDAEENLKDYQSWTKVKPLFIGFEGAPGHQKLKLAGAYDRKFKTLDRWDPVVAEVGGTWDRLLDGGQNVWGAIAASDYHDEGSDYPPCAFSRTHLRVPDKSYTGILRALRAGSFWADHGRILDDFVFTVKSDELPNALSPGEAAKILPKSKTTIRVKIQRGPGSANLPLTVELIGNGRSGKPESIRTGTLKPDETTLEWSADMQRTGGDGKSAYFRVRVILEKSPEERLLAYSNPIRLFLR